MLALVRMAVPEFCLVRLPPVPEIEPLKVVEAVVVPKVRVLAPRLMELLVTPVRSPMVKVPVGTLRLRTAVDPDRLTLVPEGSELVVSISRVPAATTVPPL